MNATDKALHRAAKRDHARFVAKHGQTGARSRAWIVAADQSAAKRVAALDAKAAKRAQGKKKARVAS